MKNKYIKLFFLIITFLSFVLSPLNHEAQAYIYGNFDDSYAKEVYINLSKLKDYLYSVENSKTEEKIVEDDQGKQTKTTNTIQEYKYLQISDFSKYPYLDSKDCSDCINIKKEKLLYFQNYIHGVVNIYDKIVETIFDVDEDNLSPASPCTYLLKNHKDDVQKIKKFYQNSLQNKNNPDNYFFLSTTLNSANLILNCFIEQSSAKLENKDGDYFITYSENGTNITISYQFKVTNDTSLPDNFGDYTHGAFKSASPTGACLDIKDKNKKTYYCSDNANESICNQKTQYFLAGMQCSDLKETINGKVQPLNIEKSKTEKINKEKVIFKPQVPFGDIKEGINLVEYINAIYKYLVIIASVIAALYLIIAGIRYLKGDGTGLTMAKNAVIGLILLLSSYNLLKIINPDLTNLTLKEIPAIEGQSITTKAAQNFNPASKKIDVSKLGDKPNIKLHSFFDLTQAEAAQKYNNGKIVEVGSDWCFPVALPDLRTYDSGTPMFPYTSNYDHGTSFGDNRSPKAKQRGDKWYIHCHAGVDILTDYLRNSDDNHRDGAGTVIAIADGTITHISKTYVKCGQGRFQGWAILVDHGDFQVKYCELNANDPITIQLKVGQKIKRGQILGKATYCGMLHFEMYPSRKVYKVNGGWFNFKPPVSQYDSSQIQAFVQSRIKNCLMSEEMISYKSKALMDGTHFLNNLYNTQTSIYNTSNITSSCGFIPDEFKTPEVQNRINAKKYTLDSDIKEWLENHMEYNNIIVNSKGYYQFAK